VEYVVEVAFNVSIQKAIALAKKPIYGTAIAQTPAEIMG
jgi:hypothetical protein